MLIFPPRKKCHGSKIPDSNDLRRELRKGCAEQRLIAEFQKHPDRDNMSYPVAG